MGPITTFSGRSSSAGPCLPLSRSLSRLISAPVSEAHSAKSGRATSAVATAHHACVRARLWAALVRNTARHGTPSGPESANASKKAVARCSVQASRRRFAAGSLILSLSARGCTKQCVSIKVVDQQALTSEPAPSCLSTHFFHVCIIQFGRGKESDSERPHIIPVGGHHNLGLFLMRNQSSLLFVLAPHTGLVVSVGGASCGGLVCSSQSICIHG